MKNSILFAVIMLLVMSMTPTMADPMINTENQVLAALNEKPPVYIESDKWDVFSENIVIALKSENDGMKASAMGMVIRYSDQLDVKDAVFDVMKVYRNHPDEHMQRMALIALGQMESSWAIHFLERAEQFEESPELKQTIRDVIAEYKTSHAR